MTARMKLSIMLFLCMSNIAQAETVTESWLQQAGISCGGGLSVDAQGEIDAAVMKRLKIGNVSGNAAYKISEAETLLTQFKKEEKRQTYVDYVNCLLTLMNMASNTSQLPPQKIVLDSQVAVSALETIKRGQRFAMAPGDSIAVNNHSIIFTVTGIREMTVDYTWSNSEKENGTSDSKQQSEIIKIDEKCSLVPYKVDPQKKQVSFISNC